MGHYSGVQVPNAVTENRDSCAVMEFEGLHLSNESKVHAII